MDNRDSSGASIFVRRPRDREASLFIGLLVATSAIGCASAAHSNTPAADAGMASSSSSSSGSSSSGAPSSSSGAGSSSSSGSGSTSGDDGGVAADAAGLEEDGRAESDAADASVDALAPCTAGTLRPGNSNVTIQHAGSNRDYILHVPPGYTGKTRVPLLLDLHGSGQSATAQMQATTWSQKGDANGFIVIYPNALNARWNAGTCCSPSVEQKVDDVGFLRAVVEKTTTDGCIDRKRVYASGLSGGGLMSYRLACEAADMFVAVAPVSGATVFSPCMPSSPTSVVAFRGLMDPLVPYDGGMPLQWYFQGAKADFDEWSMLDKCTGTPTTSHGICQTKGQCAGGADVTLCSVNSGHVLYGAAVSAGAAVPDVAWEIFQRHALP